MTHDVHEAVALGDVVLSLHAGRVALALPVNLPRPRQRQSAAFNRIVAQILEHLLAPSVADPPSVESLEAAPHDFLPNQLTEMVAAR